MSWMTPLGGWQAPARRHSRRQRTLSAPVVCAAVAGVGAEQLLDPVPALLHPGQRQAEVGDRVPDHVVGLLAGQLHGQPALMAAAGQPAAGQLGGAASRSPRPPRSAGPARLGDRADRCRRAAAARPSMATRWSQICSISPSRCEATTMEMPNSAPIRAISSSIWLPAGRVEAVGRLIEQQQPRIADERLGQLDPLLHAGGVRADLPVPLLVQADVPQRVGGPLPGRGRRQARHPAQVRDELGRGHVRRQAVVLGHVAGQRPDLRSRRWRSHGRAPRPCRWSARAARAGS